MFAPLFALTDKIETLESVKTVLELTEETSLSGGHKLPCVELDVDSFRREPMEDGSTGSESISLPMAIVVPFNSADRRAMLQQVDAIFEEIMTAANDLFDPTLIEVSEVSSITRNAGKVPAFAVAFVLTISS